MESEGIEDFITLIIGSASMPIVFPPQHYKEHMLVDGGTMINLDIAGAIERCREIVDNEEDIIIDIILCNSKHVKPTKEDAATTIPFLMRVLELTAYKKAMNELIHELKEYPRVKFRYFAEPSVALEHHPIPLSFSPEQSKRFVDLGISDAINMIKKGEGISFQETLENAKMMRRARRSSVY